MPKVIFGPMVPGKTEEGHFLNVFFRTHGDWKGTSPGMIALEKVLEPLSNPPPGHSYKLPEDSEIFYHSNDVAALRVPCEPKDVPQLVEQLKVELPKLTDAVYTELPLSRQRGR